MIEYTQTLIRVENLSYEVGGKLILKNVNAEIKDRKGGGQVVALLGPSGVGKSTFFNLLSGFKEPTSGRILAHLKADGMQEVHSHIMGVVRQDYPLFEHRKVWSNLCMVCDDHEKIVKTTKALNVGDLLDMYPCELSGGQRQRVAIIQQILCSDKYILMDEPFSGLDIIAKCEACREIKSIANLDEENTVIIVTHSIEDALKVADTIWLLGRDRDANGGVIPGAYIKKEYSLLDKGFNLNCCAVRNPNYYKLKEEIEKEFVQL